MTYKTVLDLVGDIYESSYKTAHWEVVLEKICVLLNAKSAALFIQDQKLKTANGVYSYNIPKAIKFAYNHGLGKLDPGLRLMKDLPTGKTYEILGPIERHGHAPIFQKMLLEPIGIRYVHGFNIVNESDWQVAIGLHRGNEAQAFTEQEMSLLEDLHPHFERSIKIQKEFTRLRMHRTALTAGLANITLGIILLDQDGCLLYANPVALMIVENHPAINLTKSGIYATNPAQNNEIQKAIHEVTHQENNTDTYSLGLRHPDIEHPLAITIAAHQEVEYDKDAEWISEPNNTAVIYLSDPSAKTQVSPEALQKRYSLTKAEALVAISIANGLPIKQIARIKQVSLSTVKSQVKQIFQKTGVGRQSELVRLVLSNQLHMTPSTE